MAAKLLGELTAEVAQESFNRITIDGDTSTNDSFVVMCSGRAPLAPLERRDDPRLPSIRAAIQAVASELALAIVRDGEGATKLISITVEGGRDEDECNRVARAIAHSPLVKTAFFASDPNLGRLLAAIGNSGVRGLDVDRVELYLDDIQVARAGGRALAYREEQGKRAMAKSEITVRVVLNRGRAATTVWTCDLSHEYVTINAEYRT
jgi:glutamate N-acetyltransferase/amino-acid N-acetyltransferase